MHSIQIFELHKRQSIAIVLQGVVMQYKKCFYEIMEDLGLFLATRFFLKTMAHRNHSIVFLYK